MEINKDKNIYLNQLKDDHLIDIFRLEEINETLFNDYQRHDFYQIIWFTKVSENLSYFLDFNEYTLEDNQIILIFPGQIDKLDTEGKEGYLFAIHIDTFFKINQRMDSPYLNGYFSNIFISPDEETKRLLNIITDLILLEYNTHNRIMLLESYFESFLLHLSSLVESTEAYQYNSDLISELMKQIDQNFITQRETDFYAEKFGMSPKKINEICKKGSGKTVKQHLQEKLILEIKREIRLRQKSLKEIAFDLGFNEPGYFTRFFKQHTSLTPTEFRDS